MVIFAFISISITFVNMFNKINVLLLLSGAEYLNKTLQEQLYAQVGWQHLIVARWCLILVCIPVLQLENADIGNM
jgi:hypothetical protein